jgi:hypothetical protein
LLKRKTRIAGKREFKILVCDIHYRRGGRATYRRNGTSYIIGHPGAVASKSGRLEIIYFSVSKKIHIYGTIVPLFYSLFPTLVLLCFRLVSSLPHFYPHLIPFFSKGKLFSTRFFSFFLFICISIPVHNSLVPEL